MLVIVCRANIVSNLEDEVAKSCSRRQLFKCDFLEKKLSHKLKTDTIKILT